VRSETLWCIADNHCDTGFFEFIDYADSRSLVNDTGCNGSFSATQLEPCHWCPVASVAQLSRYDTCSTVSFVRHSSSLFHAISRRFRETESWWRRP